MRTIRLRVRMREVTPEVVRVIDVPAACTLGELHELLQAAIGWTDSHLHEFRTDDGRRFGVPDGEDAFDDLAPPLTDETTVGLRDLAATFTYLYDFGDDWTHDVEVLGAGADRPGCVYGEGMCPPEDVGGPEGYAELLAVLANPDDDEHEHMRAWAGELNDFDQASTDELIRRTVGRVPPSVALVLELAAGGVKLTPAGRLPRAFVRAVQTHRPDWAFYPDRPAMREDDLLPLLALHDLLRAVGLLRLRHGVLSPTRAATDELQTIRRLRAYFTPEGFGVIVAGVALAALAHHGPQPVTALAERAHPWVSPGWGHRDGTPATHRDVELELHRLSTTLRGLDLITTDRAERRWHAGPCATSLLHRAVGLAHLWSRPRYDPEPDPAEVAAPPTVVIDELSAPALRFPTK